MAVCAGIHQCCVRVQIVKSESESSSPSPKKSSSPSHKPSSPHISLSSKTWKQTKYFSLPHLSSSSFNKLYCTNNNNSNKNVSNVNRVEKAQHGTAAIACTRAWLGPSHESRFLSPSPSHQKMDSNLSPYSSHTVLVITQYFCEKEHLQALVFMVQ